MRRTKEEWAAIVRNYTSSNLTVHQFCLAERVGAQSLRNWIRQLDESSKRGQNHAAVGFVEILAGKSIPEGLTGQEAPYPATTETRGLVIRFPVGINVDVYPGTDRATLELVFDVIGNHR
jgi:transposase-like protein